MAFIMFLLLFQNNKSAKRNLQVLRCYFVSFLLPVCNWAKLRAANCCLTRLRLWIEMVRRCLVDQLIRTVRDPFMQISQHQRIIPGLNIHSTTEAQRNAEEPGKTWLSFTLDFCCYLQLQRVRWHEARADYTLLQSKSKPLTDCFTLAGSSERKFFFKKNSKKIYFNKKFPF